MVVLVGGQEVPSLESRRVGVALNVRYTNLVGFLNLSELNEETKTLSLEEFASKHSWPFLLQEENQSAIDVDSSQTMTLCYIPTQVASQKAHRRWVFEITPGDSEEVTLGRRKDNDIVVDDPSVSKVHARLKVSQGGNSLRLRDVGSRNGTYCNDNRVGAEKEVEVKSGTVVTFGRVPLRFISPEEFFLYLKVLREKGEL